MTHRLFRRYLPAPPTLHFHPTVPCEVLLDMMESGVGVVGEGGGGKAFRHLHKERHTGQVE